MGEAEILEEVARKISIHRIFRGTPDHRIRGNVYSYLMFAAKCVRKGVPIPTMPDPRKPSYHKWLQRVEVDFKEAAVPELDQ